MKTMTKTVLVGALAAIAAACALQPQLDDGSQPEETSADGSAAPATKENAMTAKTTRQHASVNGIELHYEVTGAGEPVILLHGGVGASEMFGSFVSVLAARRQVIAVHLQGHGRTPDIDRPLRYELLADDVAALIEHLGIEKADLVGYSLGGAVALRTAIQHSEMVHRLVVISTACKREAWYPEVLTAMEQMGPQIAEHMPHSPLFQLYPGVDWRVLFTKLHDLLIRDYDWSKQVAGIRSRTLIVQADADSIRPAQVMEMYELLGGGKRDGGLDGSGQPASQLAILPGCTHYNVLGSPALATVVTPFLDASDAGAR